MDPPGIAHALTTWLNNHPIGVPAGSPDRAEDGALDSFAAACGIVWVICAVVSFGIAGLGPGPGSKPKDFPKYFAEARNRVLASIYLRSVGQVFGFFFVGRLWKVLRQAEGEPAWLSQLALASGVASHTLGVAGNAFHGAAAFRAKEMSPNLAQTLFYLGSVFYAAGVVTPPFLASTGAVILRTNVLPRWLGWLATVEAPVFLIGRLPIEHRARELFDLAGFLGYVVWTVAMSRKLRPAAPQRSPAAPRKKRGWKKPVLAIAALAGVAAVGAAMAKSAS